MALNGLTCVVMPLRNCALTHRQRGRPRKTWKEVVDEDMNDLQLKLSDTLDRTKKGGK